MKVLFVTPSYFPIVGGSEVLTRILSRKLKGEGIHTDILTLNMNKKWETAWKEEIAKDELVSIFREPALNPFPRLPNPLSNLLRINVIPNPTFVKKFKEYDIVHFVGEADLSFPLLSLFVNKPKLFHCVAIFRNGGIYRYYLKDRVFLGVIFKKFFPNLADKFIVDSTEERELLLDMGVPPEKVLILPIGVDTKIFHPDRTKKVDNLLLFVGRIDRVKGLHILLDALSYIEIPLQLAIVGPAWDAKYVEQIEAMASAINENGLHKIMLLGNKDQNELVPWYQKASVLVCPYLYETFSNVVRESLACGTPVVSTGRHLTEDSSDGILLASKDPKSLANSITKLITDKKLKERLGQKGRKVAEQRLSWEGITTALVKIYKDMLTRKAQ